MVIVPTIITAIIHVIAYIVNVVLIIFLIKTKLIKDTGYFIVTFNSIAAILATLLIDINITLPVLLASNKWIYPDYTCKYIDTLAYVMVNFHSYIAPLLAIDRYLLMQHTLNYIKNRRIKTMACIIFGLFIYSLAVFYIAQFTDFKKTRMKGEYCLSEKHLEFRVYTALITVFIPITITCIICFILILRKLKMPKMTTTGSTLETNKDVGEQDDYGKYINNSLPLEEAPEQGMRAFKYFCSIIGSLIICRIPLCVYYILIPLICKRSRSLCYERYIYMTAVYDLQHAVAPCLIFLYYIRVNKTLKGLF